MALVAGAKKSPDNDKQKQYLSMLLYCLTTLASRYDMLRLQPCTNYAVNTEQLGPSKGGCTSDVAMALLYKSERENNTLPVASTAAGPTTANLPVRPAKDAGNPLVKTRPAPSSTTSSRVPSAEKGRLPSATKKEQVKPAPTAPGAAGKPAKKT